MNNAALRKPTILPLFNVYTLAGILVVVYIAVTLFLRMLWRDKPGIEYLYFLTLLQWIPVIIAFTRGHFTYLSFIMVFHFFQLSLPKMFLFAENENLLQTSPYILEAIKEQILCTTIIILVYYSCRAFFFSASAEKEKFQLLTLSRAQVVILSCYVLFVPLFLHKLPAWFLSVHFLLLSADIVLLFTASSPGNEYLVFFTKTAAILGSFNYFLNTGMMTLMGAIIYLCALVACLKKRYTVLSLIVFAVVGMSAIQTVKGAYRQLIFENWTATTKERLLYLGELLYAKYVEDEDAEIDEEDADKIDDIGTTLISGFMRAGDDSLERVLEATPSRVPFWKGETYMSIPFMFIPRAFWHDKPTRHFWNKYGRVYGILSEDDFDTSVGISFLAEAYMNFGYTGMYVLSMVMGLLFVLVEKSSFYIMGGYFYFPYIVLLTPLLAPGSDLGSMLNSLWVILAVFAFGRSILLHMARRDDYT